MVTRKALLPSILLTLLLQLALSAPAQGADTLVAFIPAKLNTSLRYNVERTVDTSTSPLRLWAYSETSPLWSQGGSFIVHGGLLDSANANLLSNTSSLPSLRGATFNRDPGLFVHSVYDSTTDKTHAAKGMLVWKKENFLNGFSGKTIVFDKSSTLKVSMKLNSDALTAAVHFAIKDGSTWYMSEASYVNQATSATAKFTLTDFVNNNQSNARWGSFAPTANNFDVAALKPSSFSAKNFTNVQAIGLIYRTTGITRQIANILIDSLIVSGVAENLSDWQDSTDFTLNTSITGADVNSRVTNFPVLVKLDSQNFSGWSQAQAGGADIRFTNRNGSNPLPYELVSWNATAKTAEIWVLLDTIQGNNATQTIRMHWNPPTTVSSKSSSSAVFSTTNGFAGVWHLDVYAGDTINDASANRAFGINHGAANATGAIGGAKQFNATNGDFITIANQAPLSLTTNLTLSAWIASSTLTAPSQTVMSKPGAWALQRLNATDSAQALFSHAAGTYSAQGIGSTDIANGAFHYLSATKSGTGARFFTNATLNQELTTATAPILANSRAITIGYDSSSANSSWNGVIDEIRLESIARSADWIKLCYNNQKAGQSLVQSPQAATTPPSFSTQPQPKSVQVGQSVTFTVVASGQPAPTLRWYRNGVALNDNGSISGSSTPSLAISSVQLADSGNYHCRAINTNSSKNSDTVSLTVNCPPITMSDPRDTSVNEGTNATFSVTISATQPKLQWQIDSLANGNWRPVSGATANTLSITATKALNGSLFRCILSDLCGSSETSDQARLTVRDITAPPPANGFALTFGVSATTIDIKWPTPLSTAPDLDTIWICIADTALPSFNRLKAIGIKAQNALSNPDTLLIGLKQKTTYYVALYLQDSSGNVGLGWGGNTTTKALGQPYNPITLSASYIDSAHVALTMSNYAAIPFWDYSNNNTPLFEDTTYADTVGIWFSSTPFSNTRPDLLSPSLKRYSLASLNRRGTTYLDTITVSPLSAADSFYYFAASLKWKNPDTLLSFAPEQSVKVHMADPRTPTNPCTISGLYHLLGDYDSATISLDSLHKVDRMLVKWVRIRASFNANLSAPFVYNDSILLSSITTPTLHQGITSDRFTGSTDTVFCDVSLSSKSGVVSSAKSAFFIVGRTAPPNPIVLQAQDVGANSVTLTWNALQASGIQDMRIVYDTLAPIPTATPLNLANYLGSESVSAAAQQLVFDKLNEKTTYYFAGQIQIAGLWSTVSEQARTQVTTTEADTALRITNTVHIDTVIFNDTTYSFGVVWRYDTTQDSMQVGMTWGVDSAAQATIRPDGSQWRIARKHTPDTTWFKTDAHSFLFDTTYHLFGWVRKIGGVNIPPTDSSTFSVTTPSFSRQPVVIFDQGVDTVSINNNALMLYHTGSSEFSDVADTIYRFIPPLGARSGFIAMSQGYAFVDGDQNYPFWLSFAYSTLPTGFRPSDLNIYRYGSDGLWRSPVASESVRIDTAHGRIELLSGILKGGFMVMIDTLQPTIRSLADDSSLVTPLSTIAAKFSVGDNIANPSVIFKHATGGALFLPNNIDTERINAATVTLNRTIPTTSISNDNGVRCYAIVNDGRNQNILDLSRQVKREGKSISSIAQRWVPVHVTMELQDNDASVIMQQLLPNTSVWSYDPHHVRLYRWTNHSSNATSATKWVEYNSATESLFRLTPGQVLWLKARLSKTPNFGPGVTLSLKDTVRIALPPTTPSAPSWSDIAVPFAFSMYMGDISATLSNGQVVEDLQYYHWVRDSSERFQAKPFYVPQLSAQSARIDSLMRIGSQFEEAYTVYNPHSDTVWLNFPPQPAPLSTVPTRVATLAKSSSSQQRAQWQLRISGRADQSQVVGPLIVGFNPTQPSLDKSATTFFPQPPAFAACGISIGMPDAPQRFGHAVAHRLDAQGGLCYELNFFNSSTQPTALSWSIDGLSSLPGDLQVGLWDGVSEAVTQVNETSPLELQLEPGATKKLLLLVGSQSYFSAIRSGVSKYSFALLGLYPQPCRGLLNIRYTLPFYGVDNVKCTLYDARGRLVWQHSARAASLGMGEQRMQWNGTDRAGNRCAPGLYLLKLSTHTLSGDESASLQQRVMLLQ